MKIKYYAFAILATYLLIGAGSVFAQLGDYTQNPTTNSADWTAKITSLGGTVNSNVDFESHPVGALQSGFYAVSDGVTLTATGDVSDVRNGAGPNDGNISSPPLSPGEGLHPVSNYLYDGGGVSTLTISFDETKFGAGLFTIDHFNPTDDNPLTLEAFDGPDGTGNSLGIVTSAAFNYQPNNLYFMGVTSDQGDIRSVVFTDVNTVTGDTMGLDNIMFSTDGEVVEPPEPVQVPSTGLIGQLLLILALLFIASRGIRRLQA